MRIYTLNNPMVVKINIKQIGQTAFNIHVNETTLDEVVVYVRDLIDKQNLSIFAPGPTVKLDFSSYVSSKVEERKALSFKGLTSEATHRLILESLQQKSKEPNDNNTKELLDMSLEEIRFNVEKYFPTASTRLINALKCSPFPKERFRDFTKHMLLQTRNVGAKSWQEFQDLLYPMNK